MIILPSETNRLPYWPDRIALLIDGRSISLEEWTMDRDYDQWLATFERY